MFYITNRIKIVDFTRVRKIIPPHLLQINGEFRLLQNLILKILSFDLIMFGQMLNT